MTSVPVVMVRSYLAMIPRLAAEETLDASTSVALGSGTLKDARSVQDGLLRVAGAGRRRRAPAPSPGALAAMGIGVMKPNG